MVLKGIVASCFSQLAPVPAWKQDHFNGIYGLSVFAQFVASYNLEQYFFLQVTVRALALDSLYCICYRCIFPLKHLCPFVSAFLFPLLSPANVPRIWKPASLCPDCSHANDFGFNFCRYCGFQAAPPSSSTSTSRVPLDLPAIDRRISSLQSVRAAKLYEKQKCRLQLELESFLSSLPSFKTPTSTSPRDVIRFLVWKDSKGKPRFTYLAVPTSALIPNRNVATLPDWPLVQLIAQLGNCIPFLIPLADQVIGRGYPLVTLQLIKKCLASISEEQAEARVSPRQAVPFSFNKFIKLCTYLRNRAFLPSISPLERYIVSRDLAFFCLDFYSGDRASDLGRVYTKDVLLLPDKQGLLFHHKFGKTVRGKDSNVFAVKTCPHDSMVCPIINLTTYVKLADLMNVNLREGFWFRATDPKARVSSKPFVASTVTNRLRLHLTALNIDKGETMHSFRSGCSITLSLLGASDDQVARHVGWKSLQTAQYYSQVPKVMDLSLPASLIAQGSVIGTNNVSHAESLGAEFRARNNLEGLSLAFP